MPGPAQLMIDPRLSTLVVHERALVHPERLTDPGQGPHDRRVDILGLDGDEIGVHLRQELLEGQPLGQGALGAMPTTPFEIQDADQDGFENRDDDDGDEPGVALPETEPRRRGGEREQDDEQHLPRRQPRLDGARHVAAGGGAALGELAA